MFGRCLHSLSICYFQIVNIRFVTCVCEVFVWYSCGVCVVFVRYLWVFFGTCQLLIER